MTSEERQHAESVAPTTVIVTIEVEVEVALGADRYEIEESLEDKAYWTVRHVEHGGDIASVHISDYLDDPALNDGRDDAQEG